MIPEKCAYALLESERNLAKAKFTAYRFKHNEAPELSVDARLDDAEIALMFAEKACNIDFSSEINEIRDIKKRINEETYDEIDIVEVGFYVKARKLLGLE